MLPYAFLPDISTLRKSAKKDADSWGRRILDRNIRNTSWKSIIYNYLKDILTIFFYLFFIPKATKKNAKAFIKFAFAFFYFAFTFYFKSWSILFKTTVAEISRLAASGITSEVGASITSSVTIILRRTGRQCMKWALFVTAMWAASTVQLISLQRILP